MREPSVTTKINPRALQLLRLIAAITNEKQYEILTRLLDAEARRLSLKIQDRS